LRLRARRIVTIATNAPSKGALVAQTVVTKLRGSELVNEDETPP
jgi:hypothetical protein